MNTRLQQNWIFYIWCSGLYLMYLGKRVGVPHLKIHKLTGGIWTTRLNKTFMCSCIYVYDYNSVSWHLRLLKNCKNIFRYLHVQPWRDLTDALVPAEVRLRYNFAIYSLKVNDWVAWFWWIMFSHLNRLSFLLITIFSSAAR